MKKLIAYLTYILFTLSIFLPLTVEAHPPPVPFAIQEEDGSPQMWNPTQIKVPNGLGTDNGDNTFSISIPTTPADLTMPAVGTPTYPNLDDFINQTMSSGYCTGGAITDNSDGTVAVAAGTGWIRADSSDISELKAFDFSANASVDCTDDALNYVYVDYNSGTPTISYTTDVTSLDHTSQFVLGLVYQESDHAHIAQAGQRLNNFIHKAYYHAWEHDGIERSSGLVVSEDASENLAINMTAGVVYWAYERLTISAIDTSTDGENTQFELFYRDGLGDWTTSDVNVINSTYYDDGDGTLGTLTSNKYGTFYVYVTIDGSLYVQYGQINGTLAQALADTVPATMPKMNGIGVFIAKIIIQQGATDFYGVYLPWETTFGILDGGIEGTEILSTGESGGTKFLRENGDGTCSWATVSGGGETLAQTLALGADANDVSITSLAKLEGVDNAVYLDMSVDGNADLVADTNINLNSPQISYTNATKPKKTIYLSASGATLPIASYASRVVITGTNYPYTVLAFDDKADEKAYWVFPVPNNWDGSTVTVTFYWTADDGGASETVQFEVDTGSYGNDAAFKTGALGATAVATSDTWLANGDMHIVTSGALTTSWVAGELAVIEVIRDVSADDMGCDAYLLGITITYGIDEVDEG